MLPTIAHKYRLGPELFCQNYRPITYFTLNLVLICPTIDTSFPNKGDKEAKIPPFSVCHLILNKFCRKGNPLKEWQKSSYLLFRVNFTPLLASEKISVDSNNLKSCFLPFQIQDNGRKRRAFPRKIMENFCGKKERGIAESFGRRQQQPV